MFQKAVAKLFAVHANAIKQPLKVILIVESTQ